jgi:transcriptional regulator with XRE-family HTH domain
MNKNDLKAKLLAGAKSDATWMKEAEERIINEKWQDLSFAIAVRILSSLKEKKMTQVQLAEKVGVSAQMINKIVKGKENLTLETISKISSALDIPLLEVPAAPVKIQRKPVDHVARIQVQQTRTYLRSVNHVRGFEHTSTTTTYALMA